MAHALMVLGTASNVGKSWLATGICALARRRGIDVAPFKAQNLSNNAAPARLRADPSRPEQPAGFGEIGRAQAAQALACGLEPHVDMSPLLLKPMKGGSQLVVLGEAQSPERARHYWAHRDELWALVTESYERLAAQHALVVLEGAGSPAELNLVATDLVNGRMLEHAAARARSTGARGGALLVGDIDRGGIFASLVGTVGLLPEAQRRLVRGLVVNRFRGEPRWFHPGPALLEQHSGVPVRGVIPWRPDIAVDPEDGVDVGVIGTTGSPAELDICVLHLPTVSNFEDLASLGHLPGLHVRTTDRPEQVGNPDLLVLPGSKNTVSDLRWLRDRGLDRVVVAAAHRGIPVLGLCGGYQLLGQTIEDPEGVGGSVGTEAGLGLLPVRTEFHPDKTVRPATGRTTGSWLLPAGLPVEGYEIHQGHSSTEGPAAVELSTEGLASAHPDGAVQGLVAGTYLHGFLDTAEVRAALVDALRARRGLPPRERELPSAEELRQRALSELADLLEEHLDLDGLLP